MFLVFICLVFVSLFSCKKENKDDCVDEFDYSNDFFEMQLNAHKYDIIEREMYISFIRNNNKKLSYADALDIISSVEMNTFDKEHFKTVLSIISVESNFYHNANSFLGASYGRGLMQVSEIALEEFNRKNNTNYQPQHLYEPSINVKIGCWLLYFYENHYNFTTDKAIMAYNIGCGNVINGKSADRYYRKVENNFNTLDVYNLM